MTVITYEMTFDAGHRIVGHKGKCARLHGHTYRVAMEVGGTIRDPGFVVDFGDLKEIVNEWDHVMLLWEKDILQLEGSWGHPEFQVRHGVVFVPFNPTAENMAQHLAQRILDECQVAYVDLTLWETPKCAAKASVALP